MSIISLISQILEAIATNLVLLAILIAVLIIIVAIGRTITKVKTSGTAARMAEIGLDSKKLEMVSKRAYLEGLKNASIFLTDGERKKIESVRADNAVLSRKTLATMNEVEERTNRLERGTDLGRLSRTLDKIKRYESAMFKNIGGR
ncbi:MAG: hypothetical protein KJ655_00805 [Candidatus Thermoplasmatota archaeon]|nr:hypothetical protein [Candidatus Thermoplasmatota archaeon]